MKIISLLFLFFFSLGIHAQKTSGTKLHRPETSELTDEVVYETGRSWEAYKKYAWGHDVLKPLSRSFEDWYAEPLYISPIDAYSTLKMMGLETYASEIETYVVDSLSFDKDIDAKVFEVNIRILGGLLSMYELNKNEKVLEKAIDFAERLMPAFQTKTGIPTYWVNLKTGKARGDTVNVAEAGTYLLEMGILSYYTSNPKYYQAAKRASMAIYERRSSIGLIGDVIDVNTGKWISEKSHICAGVDSYYEYLYKSYIIFPDPEIKAVWDESIKGIQRYLADDFENDLWYARVNMHTGEKLSYVITLYDAFFPALLALSGDIDKAVRNQESWDRLWNLYGIEPVAYDYRQKIATYPKYDLNPEIIESSYYLYHFTGDKKFLEMAKRYWKSIMKYCRTDVAFTMIDDVRTMKQGDHMATFFFAETLKYFYLIFSQDSGLYSFDDYIFTTEAHPFKRSSFSTDELHTRLGIK
ncbi:MAG: glycoside hydrolase family 47 protein [Bacteroidales bacterium]|nr:glycoside hydrolase family 47 protein [Bacteroidales bacterium]